MNNCSEKILSKNLRRLRNLKLGFMSIEFPPKTHSWTVESRMSNLS